MEGIDRIGIGSGIDPTIFHILYVPYYVLYSVRFSHSKYEVHICRILVGVFLKYLGNSKTFSTFYTVACSLDFSRHHESRLYCCQSYIIYTLPRKLHSAPLYSPLEAHASRLHACSLKSKLPHPPAQELLPSNRNAPPSLPSLRHQAPSQMPI